MNALIEANIGCLEQGISFLETLPAETYHRKCDEVFSSSIGSHIRHNIDHYNVLIEGIVDARIDYDSRHRSPVIEQDPSEASAAMSRLVDLLKTLESEDMDRPIEIRMHDGGESAWSRSTLRRELQFLLSHTVHHYALVVSIATRYKVDQFPEGFGVAPSTLQYYKGTGV